jgi:2-dehydro-3-deoxyphosphogluconate aldolase/(4S)-4-hydroxy-2-oxoglutarate aldolase
MNTFSASFSEVPIIGILRGVGPKAVVPVIDAAIEGGLTCIEITLNTPSAIDLISLAAEKCGSRICLGAGTVLTPDACARAIDAGARFIVAPDTSKALIETCAARSTPVIPGALTPTEIHAAWKAGAYMVKVFPVSSLGGPSYIKELRGPFDSIRLLACGGVTLKNLGDYFAAGADGIAFGGSVFGGDCIAKKEYGKISETVRRFVDAVALQRKQQ